MAYCTREDIENLYGRANVKTWGDLDNRNDTAEIDARIDHMCDVATARVNNKLRGGPYAIPFTAPYDTTIIDLTARLAAYLLYVGRPVDADDETSHPVKSVTKQVLDELRDIRAGRTRLDVASVSTWYPSVQEGTDDEDGETDVFVIGTM